MCIHTSKNIRTSANILVKYLPDKGTFHILPVVGGTQLFQSKAHVRYFTFKHKKENTNMILY